MYDPDHNKRFALLDKFIDLHRMSSVWRECMIQTKSSAEDEPETYDYWDHYLVKRQDPTEHRFCANTEVSKSYEIALEANCSRLVPDIGDFLWDAKMPKSRRKQ